MRVAQPESDLVKAEFIIANEAETVRIATLLAPLASSGDVIALEGNLGVGKTSFARAFTRARLGCEVKVPSPTFTLVQTYQDVEHDLTLWHFDLYRLKQAEELYELGFDDAITGGISLIEWPERAAALLPSTAVWLKFEQINNANALDIGETTRKLSFLGPEAWYEILRRSFIVTT